MTSMAWARAPLCSSTLTIINTLDKHYRMQHDPHQHEHVSLYHPNYHNFVLLFFFIFFFAHHTSIIIYLLFLSRAGKSFKIYARRNVVIPKCHQKCVIFDKNTEFKNIKRGLIYIIISKVFSLFINDVLLYPQSSIADPQS